MDTKDIDKERDAEWDKMLENRDKDSKDVGNEEDKEKEDNRGLPIDRGWAWAVLAGVAWYLFLFGAVRKNFGLFFVAFQEHYNTNASVTSLVATIQNVLISILSLLIMTIGMHYMTNRTSIVIAGVIKTVATIIAALSTDVRVLFFSIGIFDGIGIAMAQNPVISMLGEYFLKKRGLSNGLAFCAASTGALIFAPVLTALFQTYGFVGTMLIAAGMSFNCCVSGILLRPISSFEKKKKLSKTNQTPRTDIPDMENHTDNLIVKEISVTVMNGERDPPFRSLEVIPKHVSDLRKEHSSLLRMNSSDRVNDSKNVNKRIRTFSENSGSHNLNSIIQSLSNSKIAIFGSTSGVGGSAISVRENVERALSKADDNEFSKGQSCCVTFKHKTIEVLKIIFDASLFKNGVFPCILIMGFMLVSGGDCVLIMLPPHAKDIGLSRDQRGILMLLFSCFDLFSRIILTIIADKPFIKRTNILVFTSTVLGLTCHLLRFFNTFGSMIAFSIITGCCSQLYWALHAIILMDYLSLSKLKSSLGFMMLCHGLAISIVLPIAGAIRDHLGSYVATYHLLGTILWMGAIMALVLPYVDRRVKQRAENDILQ